MNRKEAIIEEVMNIVIEHCGYSFMPVTKEDIIGKRGNIVVQMTRCIFVTALRLLRYSKPVIAAYMHRSEQAIDDILYAAHTFKCVDSEWTYIMSEADVLRDCEKYKDVNIQ